MEDGTKIFVKEDSLLTIYDWKYEIKDRKEPLKESPKDSIETKITASLKTEDTISE